MNNLAVRMETVACSKSKRLYVTERMLALMTKPQRETLVELAEELQLDCEYEPHLRRFVFHSMPECEGAEPQYEYSPECDCEECEANRPRMRIVN